MKIKLIILLATLFTTIISWGQKKGEVLKNDTTIKLDCFTVIPDTMKVWSCGGRFTYDTTKMSESKYLFLTSGIDLAIIRVNNTDIYLNKIEENSTNKKYWLLGYKGDAYKVTLKLKMTSYKYLVNYYIGTLEIFHAGHTSIYKIHGEYGC